MGFFVALISEDSMDAGVEKTKGDEGRSLVRSSGAMFSPSTYGSVLHFLEEAE